MFTFLSKKSLQYVSRLIIICSYATPSPRHKHPHTIPISEHCCKRASHHLNAQQSTVAVGYEPAGLTVHPPPPE